ncbi:hypothetical protein NP233_g1016 [Leucocoprinus birnbaumii]|uniref:Methyltransferase domain-containing protein n=1 Tax=Leucocoprinus birnbaumii TaxID=56174 RepID=A0AAD5W309_9AGAR|nr:hypothetical protein NP233_g1016 [Leucocoprinus birnbaumii]
MFDIRLTVQHAIVEKCFGGLVHVPVTLVNGDRILDSATGNAKQVPHGAQLIGIDIESRLFPKHSSLPANISFEVQSILKLPSAWSNRFAFVHQRLLVAALRTSEWVRALHEIYRVLKPGGWVQLVEADNWVSGPVMSIFVSLMVKLGESRGITIWPDIVPDLRTFLERSGFIDICITRRNSPVGKRAGRSGESGRNNMMSLFRGIRAPILQAGGFGIVRDEAMYDELLEKVELEMESSPGGEIRWVMVCARKA